jgi:hypothetical protein
MSSVEQEVKKYVCNDGLDDFVEYYKKKLGMSNAILWDIASYCDSSYEENKTIRNLVYDIRQYHPYKTQQKPVAFNPNQFATMLYKELSEPVSGSVSAYICTPLASIANEFERELPVLLLLGDFHEGREECESSQLSLYNQSFFRLIDTFVGKQNVQTDLFIENWGKNIRDIDPSDSSIYDAINYLSWCFGKLKNDDKCTLRNIRSHYTDPRQNSSDADYVFTILQETMTYTEFSEQCMTRYKTTDPKHILMLICERMKKGAAVFLQEQWKNANPFFATYSKVLIEISQLPYQVQSYICTYYHDYRFHLFPYANEKIILTPDYALKLDYDNISNEDLYDFCKIHLAQHYDTQREINMVYWFGFGPTLDIYFLARAFKSPIGNLPSQFSILYAGNRHIENLLYFLTTQTGYYSIRYYGTNPKKCITLKPFTERCTELANIKDFPKVYVSTHAFVFQFLQTITNMNILGSQAIHSLAKFIKLNASFMKELMKYNVTSLPAILKNPILLMASKEYFSYYMHNVVTKRDLDSFIQDDVIFTEGWHIGLLMSKANLYFDSKQTSLFVDYLYSNTRVTQCKPEEIMKGRINKHYVDFVKDCTTLLNLITGSPASISAKYAVKTQNIKMLQYVLTHMPYNPDHETIQELQTFVNNNKETCSHYLKHFKEILKSYHIFL